MPSQDTRARRRIVPRRWSSDNLKKNRRKRAARRAPIRPGPPEARTVFQSVHSV